MRIAICDDESDQLALIGEYVSQYIESEKLDIEIVKFTNPSELLEYEKENGGSKIYILDIVMSGMSGIELGQSIRKYNKRSIIIYLTTTKEYSLDAFSVNAFSYLVKPVDRERLFGELDKFFTYCIPPKEEEIMISVKTAEGTMPVAVSGINAVEYIDHRLVLHMNSGSNIECLSSRDSFDRQAEEIIACELFIKSADCYLVNMKNVLSVTARGFKMKNGTEFPVTRKYADAKIKFMNVKIKDRS